MVLLDWDCLKCLFMIITIYEINKEWSSGFPGFQIFSSLLVLNISNPISYLLMVIRASHPSHYRTLLCLLVSMRSPEWLCGSHNVRIGNLKERTEESWKFPRLFQGAHKVDYFQLHICKRADFLHTLQPKYHLTVDWMLKQMWESTYLLLHQRLAMM